MSFCELKTEIDTINLSCATMIASTMQFMCEIKADAARKDEEIRSLRAANAHLTLRCHRGIDYQMEQLRENAVVVAEVERLTLLNSRLVASKIQLLHERSMADIKIACLREENDALHTQKDEMLDAEVAVLMVNYKKTD